jgi:hypothetical protein
MYANSGANSTSQPIVTAYEGAGEKVGQGGEMEVKTAEGTSIWIPNDMNSAAGYFAAGRYHNMMLFEADADSTITIGLKNTKSVAGNWVIYDNWRLVYMGAGDDAYKALATSFASTLPDYSNLGEDVIYTQSYFDTFTAAKAALAEATGKDAVKAAIATAKAAAADIELNISLWQKYQDLCKRANDVAANESYNESAREPLGDYMMDMADFINARTMTNEELQALCDEIEAAIKAIMDEMAPPILAIPGLGYRMGAVILAEIGDFSRFDSPNKILAYAGLSPSTYESGKFVATGGYAHMEKRGSRYLRYALFNAARYVCIWEPSFAAYLAKKRAEGKHYNVAISHAAKKLVRLIFALQTSGRAFQPA